MTKRKNRHNFPKIQRDRETIFFNVLQVYNIPTTFTKLKRKRERERERKDSMCGEGGKLRMVCNW